MGNPFSVPDYDRSVHMSSLTLGVTGVANVAVGMLGLQMVNIPMFLCIRRLVAPFILLYEAVVLSKFAHPSINISVMGILLGTLVAGYETLDADMVGYTVVVVNNVLSAATSVMQKQFSTDKKLDAIGVLYYNSMTSFPLSLFLAFALGEVSALSSFPYRNDPAFYISFLMCTSMGPLITYSTILCTTYNSALTTSITGNVKDIGLTIVGGLLFGDFTPTFSNTTLILRSFFGAGGYSYMSFLQSVQASKTQQQHAGDSGGGSTGTAAGDKGGGASSSSGGASSVPAEERDGGGATAPSTSETSALLFSLEEGGGGARPALQPPRNRVSDTAAVSPERSQPVPAGMVSVHAGISIIQNAGKRAKGF